MSETLWWLQNGRSHKPVMPAQAGIQPAWVSLTTLGLVPSLRWGDS